MPSQKQLAANRQNARKSTGPHTAKGKNIAKFNAVRHGLRAEQVLIPGEDEREFVDLRRRMFEDLQPNGALEIELFDGIVVDFWRLRRLRMVRSRSFRPPHGPKGRLQLVFSAGRGWRFGAAKGPWPGLCSRWKRRQRIQQAVPL